jgi:hypothetical protein
MQRVPTDYIFLVIEYGYWGRGKTEADAKKEVKKAGGKLKHYQVYLVDPQTTVDEFGYLCYPSEGNEPILFKQIKNGKEVPIEG